MSKNYGYQHINNIVNDIILSGNFYIESIGVIISLIAAYGGHFLVKKKLFPKINLNYRYNSEIAKILNQQISPLLYPLFAIINLIIAIAIYSQFIKDLFLFKIILKLAFLFLFLKILRVTANSSIIANIAAFFLIPAMIFDIFGVFEQIANYLDSYAIVLGKVRISIYIFLKAIVVLMIVFSLFNVVRRKVKLLILNSDSLDIATRNLIGKFIDILTYFLLFAISFRTIGIDMTTFTVISGAIGVGIGLGLQKIVANFIGGIILLFEKSVEVGDWIEIESSNIFGVVKNFAGRYTTIECFDGREVIVPNEDLIINKFTNWTYSNNRARIQIDIGVSYDSDLKKAKDLMIDAAKSTSRCLNYPDVECYLVAFASYDVRFTLYFWINDIIEGRSSVKSEVMMRIWEKFNENNIKIPLPQYDLHLKERDKEEKNALKN